MKKLLSAILALTLVFSLSVMAFAAEGDTTTTEAPVTTTEAPVTTTAAPVTTTAAPVTTTAAPVTTTVCATCPDPVDTLEELLALIQSDEFKAEAKAAIEKMKGMLEDSNEVAPFIDGLIKQIEEKFDIDVDQQIKNFTETDLYKWLAENLGIYSYKPAAEKTTAAPVTTTVKATEVPKTGSAVGGIAIFATLSIAAAAAFVCTKKK